MTQYQIADIFRLTMKNKWQNIIQDLLQHMSQAEIAEAINGSQARISDIANGKQKKITHEDGEVFLRLHKKFCK